MASAGPDEILVSEATHVVVGDLPVVDKGLHTLKGLDGERRLFAVTRQSGSRAT